MIERVDPDVAEFIEEALVHICRSMSTMGTRLPRYPTHLGPITYDAVLSGMMAAIERLAAEHPTASDAEVDEAMAEMAKRVPHEVRWYREYLRTGKMPPPPPGSRMRN